LATPDVELIKDIRQVTAEDLAGQDALIHLAALPSDPMGSINPAWTFAVNRDATIRLALLAKSVGVKRFFFASSCEVYGLEQSGDFLEESAACRPLMAGGEAKLQAEQALLQMADEMFAPLVLRQATVYGQAAMLRCDELVNGMLTAAQSKGEIPLGGDGQAFCPVIHCYDLAQIYLQLLELPAGSTRGLCLNAGARSENYQVSQIASLIQELLPDTQVVYTQHARSNPSSCRISGARIHELLPGFLCQYSLERGLRELLGSLKQRGFTRSDYEGDQFARVKALQASLSLLSDEEAVLSGK
jgi:nucleoside-diphosphate-sugar epimerase